MTSQPVVFTRSARNNAPAEQKSISFVPEFTGNVEWFNQLRKTAWQKFVSIPLPTLKDEAWRRTDIKTLKFESLKQIDPKSAVFEKIPVEFTKPLADEDHGGQIILTPEGASVHLDVHLQEKGVIFSDLQRAIQEHPELVKRILNKEIPVDEDKFAALATSLGSSGVFLYVPQGVAVDKPLHSIFWTPGEGFIHASRVVVFLEEGASVTYIHESSSPDHLKEQSVHTGLMEVYVGKGASLRFVELQSFGENIWNFTHERVNVDQDGEVNWIFGALGSHLTKNFSDLNLIGRGSTGKLSGFYFTNHVQHLDHDTQQNHLAPDTTSDLLFKGALLGESRSVWQGMIYVAKVASKTDGYQANRNLVLSEKSRADSIPGLEILTDDVRCTHGSTVGKIDTDQVFYLESRGLPRKDAEKLIVEGFFDPIMQRIPFEGVRKRFQHAIEEKMKDYA